MVRSYSVREKEALAGGMIWRGGRFGGVSWLVHGKGSAVEG